MHLDVPQIASGLIFSRTIVITKIRNHLRCFFSFFSPPLSKIKLSSWWNAILAGKVGKKGIPSYAIPYSFSCQPKCS